MKKLAILATAAIVSLPTIAAASCDWHERSAQISCSDGQVYDQATRSCVAITG